MALFDQPRQARLARCDRSQLGDRAAENGDFEALTGLDSGKVLAQSMSKLAHPDLVHVTHCNTHLDGDGPQSDGCKKLVDLAGRSQPDHRIGREFLRPAAAAAEVRPERPDQA